MIDTFNHAFDHWFYAETLNWLDWIYLIYWNGLLVYWALQ